MVPSCIYVIEGFVSTGTGVGETVGVALGVAVGAAVTSSVLLAFADPVPLAGMFPD